MCCGYNYFGYGRNFLWNRCGGWFPGYGCGGGWGGCGSRLVVVILRRCGCGC